MPSLIPDFEYDIFISYRHNDNRSGWVTEFVKNLQEELSATIKEPVSVYFDSNPHDGLLETHNVDKSLEGKLKCLIFIPILSQTYCDPKSFAWEHEFVAFNKLAGKDTFGRDIKLSNGNVASRILPVKIHDLDADDKALLENELGGVIRAIEFIYKEAGVNRPLRSNEENATKNQNQTFYRNQVNKVANAIKDLIIALKNPPKTSAKLEGEPPGKSIRKNLLIISTLFFALAIAGFLLYPKFIALEKNSEPDKSIAILPFLNMSNDPEQEYFSDGLSEEIINALVQIEGLKVIARTSSFQFKGKNQDLRKIGEALNVSTVLEGSVRRSADKVRITAQLIRTSDATHLWSKTFDRQTEDIFKVQDEIAMAIANEFKLATAEIKSHNIYLGRNEEAYRLYQIGRSFYDRASHENSEIARKYFEQTVQLDSTFASAWSYLSTCWLNLDSLQLVDRYAQKALAIDPNEKDALVNQLYIHLFQGKFNEADKRLQYILSLKSEHSRMLRTAGRISSWFGRYQQGIELCKRAMELDPLQVYAYYLLRDAYLANGQFREAEVAARAASELTKEPTMIIRELILNSKLDEALSLINRLTDEDYKDYCYTLLYHAKGQKIKSDEYLQKFKTEFKKSPYQLAQLYAFRNEINEAFQYLEMGIPKENFFFAFKYMTRRFGGYAQLKADPFFIPLRGDVRFKELTRKLNFPE